DDARQVVHCISVNWGQSRNNWRVVRPPFHEVVAANYYGSDPNTNKKGRRFRASLAVRSPLQAREDLACSAIFENAASSSTASSAGTLRPISLDAFFCP